MSTVLRLHPDNPTRLEFQGKAVFLLGSTEHYGAVLNEAFDHERYLDTIAADRLNLTRVFGFYRELEASIGGELGYANTLAPRPEHYLAPWARVEGGEPGPDSLPRFDLERWNERYWARLRDFVAAAARRGVVVELTLFCNPYTERLWRHVPLHPASNVNGVGQGVRSFRDYQSLTDPSIVEHQRRYVCKAVEELNEFDNVYFEICNEPVYESGAPASPEPETLHAWQSVLVETLRETERALPQRHLVAVNAHMSLRVQAHRTEERVVRLDDGFYQFDPRIDLLNVHYISQRVPRGGLTHAFPGGATRSPDSYRFGSVSAFVALRAGAGKAIGFDEDYTGIVHRSPVQPMQNRMESWELLVGGCATYDHLDLTFTADDPTGAAAGAVPPGQPAESFDGRPLRRQLSYVAEFAAAVDLATLQPDLLAVIAAPPLVDAVAARSGADGATVTAYLADVRGFRAGYGSTPVGGPIVVGGLRAGTRYAPRVLNPRNGEWSELEPVAVDGAGFLRLDLPPFREDVLLHIAPARS